MRGLLLDQENQQFVQDQFSSANASTLLDILLNNNITRALNAEGETPLVDEGQLRETLKVGHLMIPCKMQELNCLYAGIFLRQLFHDVGGDPGQHRFVCGEGIFNWKFNLLSAFFFTFCHFFQVSLYLSCFDFNKFVAMPTENALEVTILYFFYIKNKNPDLSNHVYPGRGHPPYSGEQALGRARLRRLP